MALLYVTPDQTHIIHEDLAIEDMLGVAYSLNKGPISPKEALEEFMITTWAQEIPSSCSMLFEDGKIYMEL